MNNAELIEGLVNIMLGPVKTDLQKLLERNRGAKILESRFIELAKVHQKEAYLLICKKVRKKDLFELVKIIEGIYRGCDLNTNVYSKKRFLPR